MQLNRSLLHQCRFYSLVVSRDAERVAITPGKVYSELMFKRTVKIRPCKLSDTLASNLYNIFVFTPRGLKMKLQIIFFKHTVHFTAKHRC